MCPQGRARCRQVEAMEIREKWQLTTSWLDELPKTTAGMAGVVVFLCAGLLVLRLPTWGFVLGLLSLLAVLCWLALSGEPVVQLTWPSEPGQPPQSVAATSRGEPAKLSQLEPLEMIELPGGEFWMGSPEGELGRSADETRHRVRVSGFAMASYPVTQKLFQEVMEQNPSSFQGEPHPVESVNWFDAVMFCNKLSERVGLQPCYRFVESTQHPAADRGSARARVRPHVEWYQMADGYRLPTEAEWEYACRAGTQTTYGFGDDEAQLGDNAWFDGNSEGDTHKVGTKKPNGWGLHDLHGNVWEWCWDWYAGYQVISDDHNSVIYTGAIGPATGSKRVLRGGSFFNGPRNLRCASRLRFEPGNQNWVIGFRCVRGSSRPL